MSPHALPSSLSTPLRQLLLSLILGLLTLLALPAHAGIPQPGDVLERNIEVQSMLRRIPLPAGKWKVEVAKEASETLSDGRKVPLYGLTLVNADPGADVVLLTLQFTLDAKANWNSQPCDGAKDRPHLAVNDFGSQGNSVTVKCSTLTVLDSLRGLLRGAAKSRDAWTKQQIAPLAARSEEFPEQVLQLYGYLSTGKSDKVQLVAYANPALYRLERQGPGRLTFDSTSLGDSPTGVAAKVYATTLAGWLDSYLEQIDRYYMPGNNLFGRARAPELDFKLLERATPGEVAAAAAPPVAEPNARVIGSTGTAVAESTAASPQAAGGSGRKPKTDKADGRSDKGGRSAPVAAPSRPGARVMALVIGNSAYPAAPLANPRNDAQAIAERFRRYGIEVDLVLDANRRRMVDALANFAAKAQDADVTLLFYAGHGMQVNGVNYLLPTDIDLAGGKPLSITLEAVSLNGLLEEHLPGKTKVVFLDACRDNPLARSLAAARGGAARGLAPMNAATGTLISYATRDGSTASDGNKGNSPYTSALLQHLDEAEDIALVLRKVRQKVMASTHGAQEPWEYGSLVGDKLVLSQVARGR